ncbi:MAG: hypothetical protein CMR00_09450 [[Chlorobium] sp. 445]|nr:MAG: hypothetical protein CMR00_09450 [[Chlorobium] sp. 445]
MSNYIALFITDLVFQSQVRVAMQGAAPELRFVFSPQMLPADEPPALAVFDLSSGDLEALRLFREKFPEVATLAFLPHVETTLRQHAVALGCLRVVSRFEFSNNIRKLLTEPYANV